VSKTSRLKQLASREYLPMAATIALWAVVVAAVGHADAARLLAAVAFIRAVQLLTKLNTSISLKRRMQAPREIRRQARRFAFELQAASLVAALVLLTFLVEAMKAIGQQQIAAFLPFIALGMPARHLRFADVRTASPYFRLALTGGGLAMVLIGWAAGWHAAALGFAFGAREWIAYAVLRWWPRAVLPTKTHLVEPLRFAEIGRYSAIMGRRLMTYRLTKGLLTVFGPFGTAAARTGRGLDWHRKIEPYLPHHFGGFVLFSTVTAAGAVFLALRSGEPAAMVASGGLLQISAAAVNLILLWRHLPPRDGEPLSEDDEADE
jgi:hypothetical protein